MNYTPIEITFGILVGVIISLIYIKIMTWNDSRKLCPECGLEPAIPGLTPHMDEMMLEEGGIHCSTCGGVYVKKEKYG